MGGDPPGCSPLPPPRVSPWRAATLAVALLASPCLLVCVVTGVLFTVTSVRHWWVARPFTAEAWRAADMDGRGAMVDDLLATHALVGRTRAEMEALLGPPTWPIEHRVAHHRLGDRQSIDWFGQSLFVVYDEHERCVGVWAGSND